MAELVARIDGKVPFLTTSFFCSWSIYSPSGSSSRSAERGIYAICIPMDELFTDAGNQCAKYHQDVGHLSCKASY
jgi:hypothetical protein